MPVPFQSKLSYALRCVTGSNREDIYSRVVDMRGTADVKGQPRTVRVNTLSTAWVRAAKVKGEADAYTLVSHYSRAFVGPDGKPLRAQSAYEELPWQRALSRKEALHAIRLWEKLQLQKDYVSLSRRQPFRARQDAAARLST